MKTMNTDLTEKYAPLKKRAEQLTADLNSGGFDADLEWIWSDDAGGPLPAVTVAGTGVLTLGFDGSVYRFVLPRRKALTCRFPVLAAKYRLSVYGSDFPEDRLYEEGSDGSDVAFALAGSREAFINVGLKTDAAADILTFRTILADIERSMYDE